MPLDGEPLSSREIDLISRWIDEGARWEKHWAYIPPDPSIAAPAPAHAGWPANDIDRFISAAMAEEGLAPNPEAPKEDLLRRLYFDLTGLPPTPEEAAAFLRVSSDEITLELDSLPVFRIGNRLRIRRNRLLQWIEEREKSCFRKRVLSSLEVKNEG